MSDQTGELKALLAGAPSKVSRLPLPRRARRTHGATGD